MGQEHEVLTVDEGLYPKLMELKWSNEQYKDVLIPCLGGLHIGMNFFGVIGLHMDKSGLRELWIECDVLGANSAQHVMAGKGYARSRRTHKLTLQALWQVLLPRLNDHLDSVDVNLRTQIVSGEIPNDSETIAKIVTYWHLRDSTKPWPTLSKHWKKKTPIMNFGGIIWRWSAYYSTLSKHSVMDLGISICMRLDACFHSSSDTTISTMRGGAQSTLRRWQSCHKMSFVSSNKVTL